MWGLNHLPPVYATAPAIQGMGWLYLFIIISGLSKIMVICKNLWLTKIALPLHIFFVTMHIPNNNKQSISSSLSELLHYNLCNTLLFTEILTWHFF